MEINQQQVSALEVQCAYWDSSQGSFWRAAASCEWCQSAPRVLYGRPWM